MDFKDMDEELLPVVNVDQILRPETEVTETDCCMTEETQTKLPPTIDNSTEQVMDSGDGLSNLKIEPLATSTKSKQLSIASETKSKGVLEFVRIRRPHLPRKSKNKAYKMLQNIAKGIAVDSSFSRGIFQKKPIKRHVHKRRARNNKTKSMGVRSNVRSLHGSSDSFVFCRCGYNSCRIPRY